MIYALIQLLTAGLCLALYRSIRQHSTWYYVGAIAIVAVFFYGSFFGLPEVVWRPLFYLIKQCMWGMAFFVVVMFVGVLPKSSPVGQKLRSIRGELSIIAWILCLGHLIYLNVIPPLVNIAVHLGFAMPAAVIGLVVSIVLLVLLVVLGVTSFKFVKKRMSAKAWKAVQWWAYPFYGLVWLHLILMIAPTALQGALLPLSSAIVYTAIFGSYLVLRVRKALADRAAREQRAEAAGTAEAAQKAAC